MAISASIKNFAPTLFTLPLPQNSFCSDQKVQRVFFTALAGLLLGGLVGGGWMGGLLGAMGGGTFALFFQRGTLKEQIPPLNKIQAKISEGPALKAIQSIKMLLSKDALFFQQTYDHHLFHKELTVVTDQVKKREDLSRTWRVFLQKLHHTPVSYSDGTKLRLDLSQELSRLSGATPSLYVETLSAHSSRFQKDLIEIEEIQRESFGQKESTPPEQFKRDLSQPGSNCLVVRKKETSEVIGFLYWVEEADKKLHIRRLGRKADAAQLGVGERLLRSFFSHYSSPHAPVRLEVRKSNASAIALYQKFGFKQAGENPSYYSYPREDALLLVN